MGFGKLMAAVGADIGDSDGVVLPVPTGDKCAFCVPFSVCFRAFEAGLRVRVLFVGCWAVSSIVVATDPLAERTLPSATDADGSSSSSLASASRFVAACASLEPAAAVSPFPVSSFFRLFRFLTRLLPSPREKSTRQYAPLPGSVTGLGSRTKAASRERR